MTYPAEFRDEVVAYANTVGTNAAASWYGLSWPTVSKWQIEADPTGGHAATTRHGTARGYARGCRCQQCRDARAEWQRNYRRQHQTPVEVRQTLEPQPDLTWTVNAACQGKPTDLFFPEGSAIGPARRVCDDCPVKQQCLEHAIEFDERGVWGGTSERQRERMRRERSRSIA